MGAAGDGPQGQFGDAILTLQNGVFRSGGFTFLVYITRQTGKRPSGNGGIDDAAILRRTAEDQGMVGFMDPSFVVEIGQNAVDVGIFRQQHNAEGVPGQPGDGMEGAFWPVRW